MKTEYVSSSLAEAMYLFEPERRDRTVVLCDVGYITTSFSIIVGDGVIYQKSFSYGGGHIAGNLAEVLDIDFDIAEKLKRKVNLGNTAKEDESYSVIDGDKEYLFPVKKVNEIVLYSLDELCENIDLCVKGFEEPLPDYIPLSLTGGGVTFIRGYREHMSNRLGMVIEPLAPNLPYMNKPTQSSYLALLDMALNQVKESKGFLKKIFG
jgi:cell division ATPase FtsA